MKSKEHASVMKSKGSDLLVENVVWLYSCIEFYKII
jgi:hypothetical protein